MKLRGFLRRAEQDEVKSFCTNFTHTERGLVMFSFTDKSGVERERNSVRGERERADSVKVRVDRFKANARFHLLFERSES